MKEPPKLTEVKNISYTRNSARTHNMTVKISENQRFNMKSIILIILVLSISIAYAMTFSVSERAKKQCLGYYERHFSVESGFTYGCSINVYRQANVCI